MTTFGIIVGNRGFFPDALARDGRVEILRVLESLGYGAVCLTPEQTKFGAVPTEWDGFTAVKFLVAALSSPAP